MNKVMGKRELNKAKRRASIVESATRYFLEHGYAATSMSAIADEMGGSKATLWAHFSSKEELFSAVVDAKVEAFAQSLGGVIVGQNFSKPGLRRFCLHFLDCLMCDEAVKLYRLIMGEGERFPEIVEMFYSRGPARMFREVCRFFATRFPEDEAAQLARLTVSAITGFRSDCLIRPTPPSSGEAEAFVDNFLDHLRLPAEA